MLRFRYEFVTILQSRYDSVVALMRPLSLLAACRCLDSRCKELRKGWSVIDLSCKRTSALTNQKESKATIQLMKGASERGWFVLEWQPHLCTCLRRLLLWPLALVSLDRIEHEQSLFDSPHGQWGAISTICSIWWCCRFWAERWMVIGERIKTDRRKGKEKMDEENR